MSQKIVALGLVLLLAGCAENTPPRSAGAAPSGERVAEPWKADPFPSTYHAYPGIPTLVTNVTIYDGEGGRIEGGSVLFADGKVQAVGRNLPAPAGATVIDGTGKWVTPGVIDVHSHLGVYPSPGVKALSDTLDTVGTLARSVPDAAYLAAAVSGRRQLIIEQPWSGKLRIGICRTYEWKHALPETVAALESAAGKLGAAGAQVSEIKLPPTYANLVQAQCDIMFFEEVQSLAHERLAHAELLSKNLRALLDTGLAITHERYDAAQMLARNCRRTLGDVFADCDVLLAPSAPGAAPAGLNMTGDPVFNRMWTLLRTPCVTLPVATAKNGLPVGLQVIGAFGSDVETLAGAHWIHQALK